MADALAVKGVLAADALAVEDGIADEFMIADHAGLNAKSGIAAAVTLSATDCSISANVKQMFASAMIQGAMDV